MDGWMDFSDGKVIQFYGGFFIRGESRESETTTTGEACRRDSGIDYYVMEERRRKLNERGIMHYYQEYRVFIMVKYQPV